MNTDQSLAVMKALADRSRLAIVNSLLNRSQYVEEIAQRHELAPSTVSFHLRKLEKAGLVSSHKEQYYVVFKANDEIFDTTLREIVSAHPLAQDIQVGRMEGYRRKVLESFFRHGRLEKLPAQHKKRLIVLEQFARRFEPGRRYDEGEVTELIAPFHDDYCTIRRLLVDEGMIRREGSSYWREGPFEDAAVMVPLPTREPAKTKQTGKSTDRSEIKRLYKQNRPDAGIYQIRNLANGRFYVGSTPNLEGTRNSRMFQLRMGKVVFSRELQEDLDQFGSGNFEFSILDVLEKTERHGSSERALEELHLRWLEKLQPFGDRGYNSIKAYQRDRDRMQSRNG